MSHFDPNALKEAPARAMEDFADDSPAPAVLIEVARDGLSVRNATGTIELDGDRAASTDNTFEVGSQTKMMTSVIIQQLVGEGAIDFDAPLSEQMDLSGLEGIPNIEEVTVRELLANRSGIPDFDTVPGEGGLPAFIELLLADPTQTLGPDGMLALVADQPADFEPGEGYGYSNTNYLLLQKLIEQTTGDSFAEVMSDRIFSVAGMDDSSMRSEGQTDGMLRSYAELFPGDVIDVTDVPIDFGASGGVVSTTFRHDPFHGRVAGLSHAAATRAIGRDAGLPCRGWHPKSGWRKPWSVVGHRVWATIHWVRRRYPGDKYSDLPACRIRYNLLHRDHPFGCGTYRIAGRRLRRNLQ
ncbi:serine hydrolase domain-containing protein [Fontisubflavum oceani]|uniref:serine hydrolase domain-containing protein n=1 Tax=Fontisubflavum oceani TaxID=2978973 RepID=UPI0025B3B054|nr:serine hydrolase domain-containing protein [Fontisubflavum oceani]WJY22578.1 serine hydrolase domain-containing protein [Fontisubflavum oceani]